MTMRAEILDPRTDAVPADWDAFVVATGLIAAWRSGPLTSLARCLVHPLYLAVVYDAERVVAVAAGELAGLRRRRGRYVDPAAHRRVGWFDCHLPLSCEPGVAFAADADAAQRSQAVRTFEAALRRRLGARCPAILYRQLAEPEVAAVAGRFRLCRPTAPDTLLANRWSTMSAWFADLPRRRRCRFEHILYRTNVDDSVRCGQAVSRVDPVQASRLAHLTRLKHARDGEVVAPIPVGYFERLNALPGVCYFTHQSTADGRLLGFDLVFEAGARLVATVTGSVADSGQRELYFDRYLREINHLITTGADGIEFGKGLLELKQRFGCTPVPQRAVLARPHPPRP